MKQPEIGKTVADLRLKKGMTQEKLAELCEVSTRTIQRIESGEVDPRSFTLNNLSNILEFDFYTDDEKGELFWITLMHVSSVLAILIIPLLIWSFRKKSSLKIDDHGRMVLNFQITMTILLFGTVILYTVLMPALLIFLEKSGDLSDALAVIISLSGIVPLIALGIICFVQGIRNALRALQEQPCRYILSIPFLR
ncbi:helix-turn-helix domain-containing protein [Spirochaeta isovalerica]|uniref:Putative Tic20 family protein n=1 Tax=Spirochaeta isovalerica TaxID=150 RepID=A0A841RA75_9SPIO|nr:helix-turn-helix domain-containing protein [Spirochaeta isovalerica]MBB6482274.1 putative Tic20 family protein [Spirochaeta isovalerica]